MASAGDPVVLQLRVVLRGVSPLIWRRILVRADSTIADLHATLQLVLGWSDDHLHRFVIHGREYGISYMCGVSFRDDPHEVTLGSLRLREGERFSYEYDLNSGWSHDIRVEAILPETTRCYPVCTGGRRAVPPEVCSGAWSFMELRQRYVPVTVTVRLLEMFDELFEGPGDVDALRHEFDELRPWAGEAISNAFVESAVNQVVSKRMVKKQQMRWTPRGAHLLLQVRTRVLNDELADVFCRWYPEFAPAPAESTKAAA